MDRQAYKHLRELESEAVFILRECAAQFDRSVILFSGGKDSITLVHLAMIAFYPLPIPFSLLHIDTGHNFDEALEFRDTFVKQHKLSLEIRSVESTMKKMGWKDGEEKYASRNIFQSRTLLDAVSELGLDACIGGARRDEEKARAKERIFSLRNNKGEWQPEFQRPELWNIYNGKKTPGEHFRVFPISNWTELDVWEYIKWKKIQLPSVYYSHKRECIELPNKQLIAVSPHIKIDKTDRLVDKKVRFRTVGDMTCTAAIESTATDPASVIAELKTAGISERGQTRLDDRISQTAMEDRKKEGYF